MGARDPRVDAYIAESADFAKPILAYVRELVHATCPQTEETLKWGMPTFMHHGMLCGVAAFKQHCTFGFWKHGLVVGAGRYEDAMGQFGRITKVADLPPKKELVGYIKKAMQLNEDGIRTPRSAKRKPPPRTPADLAAALKKNRKALATYETFSPTAKRDYVEWITEAKTDATRLRRLATAVEWMAKGKQRNWKYMNR
jgi:uncharacterized protein YdeI (YjbR/CyaY-like superfamily)